MLIHEIIENRPEPLHTTSTVSEAVAAMQVAGLRYYPIVSEQYSDVFVGQASLDDIQNYTPDGQSEVEKGAGYGLVIRSSMHVLEAAHIMLSNKRNSLPVVAPDGMYVGILSKPQLIESITRLLNLGDPGTLIMVELKPRDFMLSDIIRIIESEGARILTLTVQSPDAINENYRISVKLNLDDLSRVGSALRRYGYLISIESAAELSDDELSDKADAFMRFLDI
ncbi:MAG: CBS domain-containing protein [Bacteroidetes bacterium]|nr:CBS domain-containing protein [Bacteroidota bacterium]MCH8524881.1 CBS domain-containing protein [Balneolales bacterium]